MYGCMHSEPRLSVRIQASKTYIQVYQHNYIAIEAACVGESRKFFGGSKPYRECMAIHA